MTDTGHRFTCHTICGDGIVQGEALISPEAVCFYMMDFETGTINEPGHALEGQRIKDKILIIPSGKGSSVVQDEGLYALKKHKSGPRAIIVQTPDTILVAGAIVMDFVLIDGVDAQFFNMVADKDAIQLDCRQEKLVLAASTQAAKHK